MTIQKQLKKLSNPLVAKQSQYFFKTKLGEYGHGDKFIGVKTADLRRLAKENVQLDIQGNKRLIESLVGSKIHEERSLGFLILVYKYKKAKTEADRKTIFRFYVSQFKNVNNWDLVDMSCPYIVGAYLMEKDRRILYKWAKSKQLWTRRIAIVSNWWFIRNGDLEDVFKISTLLLKDDQDLIHKAVGWMLREAGKKNLPALEKFLDLHCKTMPRTMLRYAIEKFPERKRQSYLKARISS